MEIKQYAPVLIPTLNRYEHFINCLESLEKCTGADKTDVYVSLDYPPSDKYKEGWQKISEYLTEKEKPNGFKCLTVIRQTKNLGVSYPSNYTFLKDLVIEKYDRYISTEDDNVFSYRFLEYINLCLDKYENDDSVYAVTGYLTPIDMPKVEASVMKLQEMSAWGCGFWKAKRLPQEKMMKLVDEMLTSTDLRKHFVRRRPSIYTGLMHMKSTKDIWGDCFITAYEYYAGKYCIYPTTSLVQNHGWDGTGTHGGVVKGFSDQIVEGHIEQPFEIIEATSRETALIDHAVVKYWKRYEGGIHNIVDSLEIAIYSLTGKIVMFENLKKIYKKIRSCIQK